jgi:hypothetical protein
VHAILLKDLGQLFDLSSCRCSQSPNRDWAAGCRRFDGNVTRHARAKSGAMAKGRTSSVFYRFSEQMVSARSLGPAFRNVTRGSVAGGRSARRSSATVMEAQVERSTRLIAHDPGIVSRRDQVDISGSGFSLGAILHPEAHPPGDEIAEVPLRAQLTFDEALLVL